MVSVFFSYSHRDEEMRDELEVHLASLKRQGVIDTWHDRRIGAGRDFAQVIDKRLEQAKVILLLVSPYFIASDYCYDVEMKKAMKRNERGESRVIPVILHPCDWQHTPFSHLLAVPKDGKPITKYLNPHDAFLEVARAVREAVGDLTSSQKKTIVGKASISESVQEENHSSDLVISEQLSDRDEDTSRTPEYDPYYHLRYYTRVDVKWLKYVPTLWQNTPKRVRIVIEDSEGEKHVWLSGRNKKDEKSIDVRRGMVRIRIRPANKRTKGYDVDKTLTINSRTTILVSRSLYLGRFEISGF